MSSERPVCTSLDDWADGELVRYTRDARGLRTAMADDRGAAESAYDALDRLTSVAFGGGTTRYGYDAVGNVVRETADGARDLKDDRAYAYDALRRLVSVTDRQKKATTYRYDPVANRTATLREGRLLETATYGAADQLTARLRPITSRFAERAAEQFAERGIRIRPISGLTALTRAEARAVEQVLIEGYGLGRNGGTLINRINSISSRNPIYREALETGRRLLQEAGYELPR